MVFTDIFCLCSFSSNLVANLRGSISSSPASPAGSSVFGNHPRILMRAMRSFHVSFSRNQCKIWVGQFLLRRGISGRLFSPDRTNSLMACVTSSVDFPPRVSCPFCVLRNVPIRIIRVWVPHSPGFSPKASSGSCLRKRRWSFPIVNHVD